MVRTSGQSWDVPTPRASRDSSPDQANVELDIREWEEGRVADGAYWWPIVGRADSKSIARFKS